MPRDRCASSTRRPSWSISIPRSWRSWTSGPPDYPLHGRSAYGPDANAPREARFGFDPNKHLGPNVIEFRIEDQSDLRNSDLTVIGPATDPDLWRAELKK